MSGEELLKEVKFKEELEKLINSYVKEISVLHLIQTMQLATNQLNQIALAKIEEAKKEQAEKQVEAIK